MDIWNGLKEVVAATNIRDFKEFLDIRRYGGKTQQAGTAPTSSTSETDINTDEGYLVMAQCPFIILPVLLNHVLFYRLLEFLLLELMERLMKLS